MPEAAASASTLARGPAAIGASDSAPHHHIATRSPPPAPQRDVSSSDQPAATVAPSLAGLHEGAIVAATIERQAIEPRIVLRTESATLALQQGELPADASAVTLRIVSAGAAIVAEVLAIDGEPQQPPPTITLSLLAIAALSLTPNTVALKPGASVPASALLDQGEGRSRVVEHRDVMIDVLRIEREPRATTVPTALIADLPARVRAAVAATASHALLSPAHRSDLSAVPATAVRPNATRLTSGLPPAAALTSGPLVATGRILPGETADHVRIESSRGVFIVRAAAPDLIDFTIRFRVREATTPSSAPATSPSIGVGHTATAIVVGTPETERTPELRLAPGSTITLTVRSIGSPETIDALVDATVRTDRAIADEAPDRSHGHLPLKGIVVGHEADGSAVIETAAGLVASTALSQLARGTTLVLDVTPLHDRADLPPVATADPTLGTAALAALIGEAATALAAADPKRPAAIAHAVPQPPARLTAEMLFLLKAIGSGAHGLLGEDTSRALATAGRGDLLARLDDALAAARTHEEAAAGWRNIVFPVLDERTWSVIRLRTRTGADAAPRRSTEPHRRFVIDFTLDRLGSVQLDGLLHGDRFELIVRAATGLNAEARSDIAAIFRAGQAAVGLTGSIRFEDRASIDFAVPQVAPRPMTLVSA